MSMRDYGFDDYGLILTPFDVQFVANKCLEERKERYIKDGTPFDEDEVKPFDLNNDDSVYEAQEVADDLISYISDFEGELCKISESGGDSWDSTPADETVFYMPTLSYPSFFKQAYKDYNELIDDLKKNYGKYLPEDFDYENNFRHIVGTYFG